MAHHLFLAPACTRALSARPRLITAVAPDTELTGTIGRRRTNTAPIRKLNLDNMEESAFIGAFPLSNRLAPNASPWAGRSVQQGSWEMDVHFVPAGSKVLKGVAKQVMQMAQDVQLEVRGAQVVISCSAVALLPCSKADVR